MNSVRVKAYAKVNLTLDITGVCDGYHAIDSVVATIGLYDLVVVKKRKKDRLVSVTMHGMGSESIPFGQNHAVKAAERFISRFGCCGADITVYKNIPMGAGLGGSSADVAGVLNAMQKLFRVGDGREIKEIADGLGSDCGYLLTGGYARLGGRGEEVKPLDGGLRLDLLLFIPPDPVSTAECYRRYDGLGVDPSPTSERAEEALLAGDKERLAKSLSNALFAPAVSLNPQVERAREELASFDPLGVNMTGSGSAVYAVFENEAFCDYAASRYRGECKVIKTKTNLPKGEKIKWRKKG